MKLGFSAFLFPMTYVDPYEESNAPVYFDIEMFYKFDTDLILGYSNYIATYSVHNFSGAFDRNSDFYHKRYNIPWLESSEIAVRYPILNDIVTVCFGSSYHSKVNKYSDIPSPENPLLRNHLLPVFRVPTYCVESSQNLLSERYKKDESFPDIKNFYFCQDDMINVDNLKYATYYDAVEECGFHFFGSGNSMYNASSLFTPKICQHMDGSIPEFPEIWFTDDIEMTLRTGTQTKAVFKATLQCIKIMLPFQSNIIEEAKLNYTRWSQLIGNTDSEVYK